MTLPTPNLTIPIKTPHPKQWDFISHPAKRKIIKAGRRGGKTTGIAIYAIMEFMLRGRRILYTAPTTDQTNAFWGEVFNTLQPILATDPRWYVHEGQRTIVEQKMVHGEWVKTKHQLRAKTAWNSNTLRGDHADILIFDEWQLMDETSWDEVGAPMLMDTNGDAVFIYTPPSMSSRAVTKAIDPFHARKMFKAAKEGKPGWAAFEFTSYDNPYLPEEAIAQLRLDMTERAFRQEILVIEDDEDPRALFTRANIAEHRIAPGRLPELTLIAVGVDPSGGGDEIGIVVAGKGEDGHGYILADYSLQGSPGQWADEVLNAYEDNEANMIIVERNFGGDMAVSTITTHAALTGREVPLIRDPNATRGKDARAEPIAAAYERGVIHHVGTFERLEDEMASWIPGSSKWSPNRLDAMVWAVRALNLTTADSAYMRPWRGA